MAAKKIEAYDPKRNKAGADKPYSIGDKVTNLAGGKPRAPRSAANNLVAFVAVEGKDHFIAVKNETKAKAPKTTKTTKKTAKQTTIDYLTTAAGTETITEVFAELDAETVEAVKDAALARLKAIKDAAEKKKENKKAVDGLGLSKEELEAVLADM